MTSKRYPQTQRTGENCALLSAFELPAWTFLRLASTPPFWRRIRPRESMYAVYTLYFYVYVDYVDASSAKAVSIGWGLTQFGSGGASRDAIVDRTMPHQHSMLLQDRLSAVVPRAPSASR